MTFPLFLSVVVVVRNQAGRVAATLAEISAALASLVADHELIVVDNGSADETVAVLKSLTQEGGIADLQVYALVNEVAADVASWAGLESALGDFVAVLDPLADDAAMLAEMLQKATDGADVVFATNRQRPARSLAYRLAGAIFNTLYERLNGVHLGKDAPQYRLLSRRVVNHILQHPHPAIVYRHLPAMPGFARAHLTYSAAPKGAGRVRLADAVERGLRLLVSTTRAPMRLVTTLSLFGAVANVVYSGYVILIALLKEDVAPGWVTLSLQQSGMFFLISLVLLVLGEYILQMASLSNEGPAYVIAQEFTSARLTRREKLNLEEAPPGPRASGAAGLR